MKKTSIVFVLFVVLAAISATGFSKTVADFWVGKWEITVVGTPDGDTKMVANLTREGGVLAGQLINMKDSTAGKIPVSVTEEGNRIIMGFSAQGYDVTIDLAKVDEDNLKGNLLNMFDATAKRLK